jgi:ABC-2 type transport system ATP-binding protein
VGVVVEARGAGVRHHRRWVFRDLDVTISAGETVAVTGPPGSGRTTVLLALAGRFKLSAGSVSSSGTASLAYVPSVTEPEPVLTVGECVRERLALLGRSAHEPVDLSGLDPSRKAWELSPYEKQVLGLVLAGIGEPAVIALDGLDIGLDADEQAAVWGRLAELAAAGAAVIATTRTADPGRVTTLITLGGGGETHVEPDRPAPEPENAEPENAASDDKPAADEDER